VTELLLSPHNDDAALFASYVCLRHRPKVIDCILGARKKLYPLPEERVAESAAAMGILGCEFEQLPVEVDVDWAELEQLLRAATAGENFERVWAPLPEIGGHRHHNRLGLLAVKIWGARVSFYATYTCDDAGKPTKSTVGEPVAVEAGWPELKRQALDCYRTQIERSGTAMHFEAPLDEYTVPSVRLNLGGGLNAIPGFVNLDKSLDRGLGWSFEDGLGQFPDESVDAITESHALMYVPAGRWPFVFDEIARVLVPGGTVRMTHDAIGAAGSRRPAIRPGAAVATSAELVLWHLDRAGIPGRLVNQDETGFDDASLIQQNYGRQPDVFHVEAVKPAAVKASRRRDRVKAAA
jgi:LmbE family N-acetylglucosaminyl deacetylase